jgi:hypothetical protein
MKNIVILAALLMALGVPVAQAQTRQFSKGEAVQIDPNQAYVMARTQDIPGTGLHSDSVFSIILYRALSDAELAEDKALADKDLEHWKDKATPNVVLLQALTAWQQSGLQRLMVAAIQPGTYILGGVGLGKCGSPGDCAMVASLCMGTVRFEAKPGVITDLGSVLVALDDRPTDIPELANVVIGKETGLSATNLVAIRPAPQSTPAPAALAGLQRVPADYRAVSAFPNYTGSFLSRLARLPGVLDYDKDGDVVDLKAQNSKAQDANAKSSQAP